LSLGYGFKMKSRYFKNIRINSIYCIIFSLFFYVSGYPIILNSTSAEIIDRIVAVVNDDVITLTELNSSLKPYAEKIRSLGYPQEKEQQLLFKVRKDILDHLIDQKIEDQEIKRSKVEISEDQIDRTIEQIKQTNYLTDEQLRAELDKDGMTMEGYREKIKGQLLRTRLVNLKVKSKIVITKEDIKAYYEKHIDEFSEKPKYHLRNIILKVPLFTDTEKKLEIKTKMDDSLEKLKSGESFEALAAKYSESPAASDGGDLGEFEFDSLSPQFQKAIEKIKPGEFTPVLDTDLGYQIFFLENIVSAKGKTLEEVTPEIESKLYNETIDKKYGAWIGELRKQSVIKIIQ
jgi:peptidyl-prolyl cis-trans isomerase SurA